MLQRFPEEVRFGLGYQDHDRGRMFSQMPVGCEIRFVTDAHFFRISLASYEKDNRIFVFRGNFLQSVLDLPAGKISTFHIEEPAGWSNIERLFGDTGFLRRFGGLSWIRNLLFYFMVRILWDIQSGRRRKKRCQRKSGWLMVLRLHLAETLIWESMLTR